MIGDVEIAFADAWAAHNRAELAAILQPARPAVIDAARTLEREALDRAIDALDGLDPGASGHTTDDRRAVESMRETLDLLAAADPALTVAVKPAEGPADHRHAREVLETDGLSGLLARMTAEYAVASESIDAGEGPLDRLDVLARLATEPDEAERRRLFLSLAGLWQAVDGDGGPSSPYRVALRASAEAWQRDGSPVAANAAALGVPPGSVEPWLRSVLEAWRSVALREPLEPWDERYASGGFNRAWDDPIHLAGLRRVNDAWYASLGADPVALGIRYDLAPRPDRAPVPVAFMLDVDVPRRTADRWTSGEHWVLASYGRPRVPDLGELLHETGHAIHFRAIRTRPAFAVLREAHTTFVEALGDLAAWDLHEPAWQERHLGRSTPLDVGLRARYADVVRDVAWSLFEIELHRTPERAPNDVWSEITERYLGIVPHPEWSWWAIRGQLVGSPGYMVNYGLGAIVTADLRARLRETRGDAIAGDPGWYDAVSQAIYRWGGEREPRDVVEAFLGRPVSPDALLADLHRLGEGA